MLNDFYSIAQQDFVPVTLNLDPGGNPLFEYLADQVCALVWYQVRIPGRDKPKKFFRSALGGRVGATELDWTKPGTLVTMREALDLCRQHPGKLGVAFVMSRGLNLSCLDIDKETAAIASEHAKWLEGCYFEPTSNGGWHILCVGRLGRNITKPIEFYSGDHLLTASFYGQGNLTRKDDALEYFDSISIQFDIEEFRPVLSRDNRSVEQILQQVQIQEPEVFNQLYMTLHAPSGTAGYDASALDMALIMSIMNYTRDVDLVYQVFLSTGFGQRLINRRPTDKKKGKNYLHNSIRRALPRQSIFWLADDFKRANPRLFNDPSFWIGDKFAAIEKPLPDYAVTQTAEPPKRFRVPDAQPPIYPELPRGGLFEVLEKSALDGYYVENKHYAKLHALDAVNSLLMPFYVFNGSTRSNMFKVITGPTSSGKGMILLSANYLRMANEIEDPQMRGHRQPFIDAGSTPLRYRWVTGPMQGSVRGLDKLYAQAYRRRPVIAIKERDFTQSLAAFFSDVATATGPARNLAELGDECTDLFDLAGPGRSLETKATGKTDAIVIPEPMIDITFEGTQEPLLEAIAPDGSNLASGRVNRWIFFVHDPAYPTRQKELAEQKGFPFRQIMKAHIEPILINLNRMTDGCEEPINCPVTEELSHIEMMIHDEHMLAKQTKFRSQGALDAYARVRMNAQKLAMLFAMERHASGLDTKFNVTGADFELAYKFLMPGYDYLAEAFEHGKVGNAEDRDLEYNGGMAILHAAKAFYKSEAYEDWLVRYCSPAQAERFKRFGVVPFKPVREAVWTNSIFNSRARRKEKTRYIKQAIEYLEKNEYIIFDRGVEERNQHIINMLMVSGIRVIGEPVTSREYLRILR